MSNIPEDLHYSRDHEWVRLDGDVATIGITDYAQQKLVDIVYVELPRVGENFEAHQSFGTVESVKATSDVFTPVSGEVIEVNDPLPDDTEKFKTDTYGEAWLIRLRLSDKSQVDGLLTAAEYEDFLGTLEE
ncbi:MAG TPA: glycine cleavage system protein GcvH [Pyrinomonadaceae bacterium]|jgi:glycine cleavage system H protein|nr:glycine cleavage system protein GcvH [Pyrinomonadaceae bacterium]